MCKRGTCKVAEAYLQYLYADAGRETVAKNDYRPTNAVIAKKYAAQFPQISLFKIGEVAGE